MVDCLLQTDCLTPCRVAVLEACKRVDSGGPGMERALAVEVKMVAAFPAVVEGGAGLRLNLLGMGMVHHVLDLRMALQMGKQVLVHTMEIIVVGVEGVAGEIVEAVGGLQRFMLLKEAAQHKDL